MDLVATLARTSIVSLALALVLPTARGGSSEGPGDGASDGSDDWRAAVELRGDAYLAFLQGIDAASAGRLSQAREKLESVVAYDPSAPVVRSALARVCLKQGDLVCARNEAERGASARAPDVEAFKVLAELELRRFQVSGSEEALDRAVEHLRRATEARPTDPWPWNVWVRLLVKTDRAGEAEAIAREAGGVPGGIGSMAWQTLARSLLEEGRRSEAIETLERATGRGDASGRLLELMAQLKEQQGDVRGLVDALEKLRRLRPGDAAVAHRLGKAHLAMGDPFAALEPLQVARRARPGDPATARDLAAALVELGRAEEALGLLEGLPAVYRSPQTLFLWVRAEEQLNLWARASARLETLHDALSEEDRASYGDAFLFRAARDSLEAGQPERALELLDRLDDSPAVFRLRLRALVDSGEGDRADTLLRVRRNESPDDPALIALELDRKLAENPDLSMEDFRRRPLAGAGPERVLRVASALVGWGHPSFAADVLDSAKPPGECSLGWLRRAAGVYYQAGRWKRAEALYREALSCDGNDHGALNDLCYLLADELDRSEEAVPLCRRAVDLSPDEASYLDSLGWALHRSGRSSEALPILREAVRLSAEGARADIREHLGDVYAALGRPARAVAEWRAALALGAGGDAEELERKIRVATDPEGRAP